MEYRTKQALETALEAIQDYYKDGCQFYGQKIHTAVDRIKLALLSEGQNIDSKKSVLPIFDVSQQRELLIDFCEVYAQGQFEDPDDTEGIVDWYMRVKDN